MSFFATTLGIGAHGYATILLDRDECFAGDVLSGRVRLSVTSRIDHADPVRMTITGRETLAYDEHEVHRTTVQPHAGDGDSGPRETSAKRVRHEEFEYTMLRDAVILDVPARAYDPGLYEFPFAYQLPTRGLVPSFEFQASHFGGALSNVRAHAEYELSVHVPIRGMLKSDIRYTCHPIIREDPALRTPCSLTETRALPVYFFFFCLKGNCDLTATLVQNVVPLGGLARVEVLVDNDSTQHVSYVTTTLYQTVTLNERRRSRDRVEPPSVTRKIATKKFSGVAAGDELRASLCQPMAYDRKGSHPLMPTMRSHFLSFDYELTVRCRQAWCYEDPTVTFPIVLTTKAV